MTTATGPILIVDDNPTNLKLMRVVLTTSGFEVHTAASAAEALTMAEKVAPRLILMDLQLPDLDGLEVTRRIRAQATGREVIVIAVTAYAMKGDYERALVAGCDDFVSKPVDVDALPKLVSDHLNGRVRNDDARESD